MARSHLHGNTTGSEAISSGHTFYRRRKRHHLLDQALGLDLDRM